MWLNYDVSGIQSLLKSFYTLTKIRIVVYNTELSIIAEYPWHDCDFCAYIQQNPAANAQCLASLRCACHKCRESKCIYTYTCHMGLLETIVPVYFNSTTICYLMFGQIITNTDHTLYGEKFLERCKKYDMDEAALREKYTSVPYVEPSKLDAAVQLMEACAGYIWLKKYVFITENELAKRLNDHIYANMKGDLSISALCRFLGVSRSKLYTVVKEYFGKGVEQLTREIRISHARELLSTTQHTVGAVAEEVGYYDVNYFIKVFKKETGMTPKQYSLFHRAKIDLV